MPKRIQLKRTKGWRKPEGAVVVTRATKWGNPFIIGDHCDREQAVFLYREWMLDRGVDPLIERPDPSELRGKDLACFCADDQICHADVLLELANA